MSYWRMQLHPSESKNAVSYTVASISAGYIGLDFGKDVGDLLLTERKVLPTGQQDYWEFAHKMKKGDYVLVFTHHFPFALVRISGPYNYIRKSQPHVGVWFRHFRSISNVKYYADYITNAKNWKHITMTDTISILRREDSESFRLIKKWIKEENK
jgi:hypothetical protein